MKRALILLSTVGLVVFFSFGRAEGGSRWDYPVTIYSFSAADGVLSSTRATQDNLALIGCYTNAYPNSTAPTITCYAEDAAGQYKTCTAANAAMATTVAGLAGDSYLYFSWDSSGACTQVFVQNDSSLAPKQP